MKKLMMILPLLVLINSCKYTEAPSAGLAKEMCSCLFISGQTEEYCKIVTKESQILADYEADYNRKEVVATGVNFKSMAKLDDNPRFGCSIQNIEVKPIERRPQDFPRGGGPRRF